MPRAARIVIPQVPHHVIQRGNRRQAIFESDQDRRLYIKYLSDACGALEVTCQTWCLMSNHVHLILTPPTADALRSVMARSHTRYAQWVNRSQDLSGHVFQGRFQSYAMDDRHLATAARYVENNPVKAGLVDHAEDWPWSSARFHVTGREDGLTATGGFSDHIPNWQAYLTDGVEASERDEAIEAALRSGIPQRTATRPESRADIRRGRGRPRKIGTVPI